MDARPKKAQGSAVLAFIAGLFFLYLYIQILSFHQGYIANPILGGLYFILFGVHEATHILLAFLPPVIVAASGSFSEIIFAGILVISSVRAKSYLATSFSLLWLMLAMVSAGRYMADAKDQLMPLIGPGVNPQHDWHFVFTELGLLEQSGTIGDLVRYGGYMVGVVGLIVAVAYIITRLLQSK